MYFLKRCNIETKPSKFVAQCTYHKCKLTPNQLKLKSCLFKPKIGNNCPHLEKLETHTYWQERNFIKEKKKSKKY